MIIIRTPPQNNVGDYSGTSEASSPGAWRLSVAMVFCCLGMLLRSLSGGSAGEGKVGEEAQLAAADLIGATGIDMCL